MRKTAHSLRYEKYCTLSHLPFYDIAGKYLPQDKDSIVVDIGAGDGSFASHLKLEAMYNNLFLLDGNPVAIKNLKNKFKKNVIQYNVPDKLPFNDSTVGFIHCSHLVEHLYHSDLYKFLKEINRVQAPEGIFIISTPLMWQYFYCDMSHVKPYYPEVFIKYLCHSENPNPSKKIISEEYLVLELIYRYWAVNHVSGWSSDIYVIHYFISLMNRLLKSLRIKKYVNNGYTLVLKKGSDADVKL